MTEPAAGARLPLVDAARGAGLVMMILYHAAWDLSWFGFIATDVGRHPAWMVFAWLTAATFLLLVGVALVLSARAGLDRRRRLRRLLMVGCAAALISLVTYRLHPASWIFFGILHHIALASVLALPFVRLPVAPTLALAAAVLAAPALVSLPLFDAPLLQWLGLGTVVPDSNDFVPLAPWFGAVLVGVAGGRLLVASPRALAVAARPRPGGVWRTLCLAGRHSLLVYLLHQPLLYGAVAAMAWIAPPSAPPAAADDLMRHCVRGCVNAGGGGAACERRCACAARTLQPLGLWSPAMGGMLTDDERERARTALRACPPG